MYEVHMLKQGDFHEIPAEFFPKRFHSKGVANRLAHTIKDKNGVAKVIKVKRNEFVVKL